jgi:hypothetical protein
MVQRFLGGEVRNMQMRAVIIQFAQQCNIARHNARLRLHRHAT